MIALTVLGVAWLAALLIIGSDAGTSIIHIYLFAFGGAGLAAIWAVRYGVVMRRHPTKQPRNWVPVVVVLGYIALALFVTFVPPRYNPLFLARFRASEAALTSEAQRVLASGISPASATRRVGLFRVERTDLFEGQVRFITTSCGVIDSCGFVYAPTAAPKRFQEDVFSPLHGRWWHLLEGF
jgi:hypothetical protein